MSFWIFNSSLSGMFTLLLETSNSPFHTHIELAFLCVAMFVVCHFHFVYAFFVVVLLLCSSRWCVLPKWYVFIYFVSLINSKWILCNRIKSSRENQRPITHFVSAEWNVYLNSIRIICVRVIDPDCKCAYMNVNISVYFCWGSSSFRCLYSLVFFLF